MTIPVSPPTPPRTPTPDPTPGRTVLLHEIRHIAATIRTDDPEMAAAFRAAAAAHSVAGAGRPPVGLGREQGRGNG